MEKSRIKKSDIVPLLQQGKTYREIGQIFGVSRQRIHQIVNGNKSRKKPLTPMKLYLKSLPKEVWQKNRSASLVKIRKEAVKTLREKFKLSFPEIGKALGYADHCTAIHHFYGGHRNKGDSEKLRF